MFLDNIYWIVCLLVCLIWGAFTFFALHARLRVRTVIPGPWWLIFNWIKIWNIFFLNSRFTIEVGLNYTQMKDSPVQKYLKKLSQPTEKCKFDLFPEQQSLLRDFQLYSQPIVLNWKLEKVCICWFLAFSQIFRLLCKTTSGIFGAFLPFWLLFGLLGRFLSISLFFGIRQGIFSCFLSRLSWIENWRRYICKISECYLAGFEN